MKHFKIAIMGSGGVGKTSMARQFVSEEFNESYEPTLEEVHSKSVSIDGELCLLELVDTAGMEQFFHLREPYIRKSDGFILVYSIADPTTFEDIKSVRAQIVQTKYSEQIPIVLVGNKRDLNDNERAVEKKEGEELAVQWPHCRFLETSAKDHSEIEEVFTSIVREIEVFQKHKKQRVNDLVAEAKKKKRSSGRCTVM